MCMFQGLRGAEVVALTCLYQEKSALCHETENRDVRLTEANLHQCYHGDLWLDVDECLTFKADVWSLGATLFSIKIKSSFNIHFTWREYRDHDPLATLTYFRDASVQRELFMQFTDDDGFSSLLFMLCVSLCYLKAFAVSLV